MEVNAQSQMVYHDTFESIFFCYVMEEGQLCLFIQIIANNIK